jgi:signal transduction histidine kinase
VSTVRDRHSTVARRASSWAFWLTVALQLVTLVLGFVDDGASALALGAIVALVALLWVGIGGRILARHAHNAIGWLAMLIGLGLTFNALLAAAVPAIRDHIPGSATAVPYLGWVADWSVIPILCALPLIFLLFPDGHLPGSRWRLVAWVIVGATAVAWIAFALTPGPLNTFPEIQSPIALPVGEALPGAIVGVATIVMLLASISTAFAVRGRYRRATGDERQQIRWVAAVVVTAGILLVAWLLVIVFSFVIGVDQGGGGAGDQGFPWFMTPVILCALVIAIGVPVAIGVSILKYRLYDLDLVIRKAVVVAVVALGLTLGGLVLVLAVPVLALGATPSADLPAIAVGLVLGLSFFPLRKWARRVADRVVYGRRATPYEVLTSFGERVSTTYSSDDVLPRMAQVLGEATGADVARVWLRIGGQIRPEVTWPPDEPAGSALTISSDALPPFEGAHAHEVRHQGELLGALSVEMPANDPIDPAREQLVGDLAAQAGLVLRNVRLIEELRASRQRLVAAQDQERRKLERNIHDGAQQQLVAQAVKLRLTEGLVEHDPAKAREMLAQLQEDSHRTLEDLRDLARGIFPPLLADKGLGEALSAQARKGTVPTTVHADGIGRYPQDVEAAVYFCTLEALNNVAKYATASAVSIELSNGDGTLLFRVTDDGRGFDPARTGYGTGLQGIADRIDALGGRVEITSSPGGGTRVEGRIPAATQEPPA